MMPHDLSPFGNPWLSLPLADYEGHMALPGIGQAEMLADLFEQELREHRPESVALFGCSGGNGLDRIDSTCTKRVVGVDLNPEYIDAARNRFAAALPGLELHIADVNDPNWRIHPVDMIFSGLLLEYVELYAALATIRRSLHTGGNWATVIQRPSPTQPFLSPSPFRNLEAIAAAAHHVDPETLIHVARQSGFKLMIDRDVLSPGKKPFQVLSFLLET